jgi:hypothetical protein
MIAERILFTWKRAINQTVAKVFRAFGDEDNRSAEHQSPRFLISTKRQFGVNRYPSLAAEPDAKSAIARKLT